MDNVSEFSEKEVLKEIKRLLCNEGIKPEPEFQFFSKYLSKSRKDFFLENENEILHLINSHGVQLRNDIKYWSDKSKTDLSGENNKKQIPVLNPTHFEIQDFNDIIKKLKELPSDWTILQITKKFSLSDVSRKEHIPEIFLTRFACGELAEKIPPYSVTTEDNSNFEENIFKVLKKLAEMRKEFHNLGRTSKKLYDAFYKTNTDLENFIRELDLYVLGPWSSLLQGRLEDSNLEKETLGQIKNLVKSFIQNEKLKLKLNLKQLDVIYQLTLAAHFLKSKGIFSVLRSIIFPEEINIENVSQLMMLVENLKMLNLSNSCALKRASRKPLILILDNEFEMVPWEMISILVRQPVCRISSFHLLYALYKYHQPYIKNGYRILDIDYTFCLVNPSQDLKDSEKEMKDFLKKRMPWAEVEIGKAPDSKDLLSKIEDYSAYLYCGHGSGSQYLKTADLKKAFVKGMLMLFGCSSNIPKNCGGRTPHQNLTYTYISNGCPCIIGCIQDLGSSDADAACKEFLSNNMPNVVVNGGKKVVFEPKEPSVLKALALGKQSCIKYWSKSAFVARGIPCKTVAGNLNVIKTTNN